MKERHSVFQKIRTTKILYSTVTNQQSHVIMRNTHLVFARCIADPPPQKKPLQYAHICLGRGVKLFNMPLL